MYQRPVYKDLVIQDVQDFNARNTAVQIVALRKDHKKRKWCPRIDVSTGIARTGYHPESYDGQESGHFVFNAELKIQGHGRGQSAYYMYLEDMHGNTYQFGATGVDMLMKMFANGQIELTSNGFFNINFLLEKKGANVYAEPVLDIKEHIAVENANA